MRNLSRRERLFPKNDGFWTIFWGIIALCLFGFFGIVVLIQILNSWPFIDPNNCSWPNPEYGNFEKLVTKPWLFGSFCFVGAIAIGLATAFSIWLMLLVYLYPFFIGILATVLGAGLCLFGFSYLLGHQNPWEIKLKGIQRLSWYICLVIYSLFATCVWTMFLFEDFWLPMNYLFSFF